MSDRVLNTPPNCSSEKLPLTNHLKLLEVVIKRCSVKKVFLNIVQNSQENSYVGVSFLIKLQGIEKNIPTQLLSCEFYEPFKNIYFVEHLRAATSELLNKLILANNMYQLSIPI